MNMRFLFKEQRQSECQKPAVYVRSLGIVAVIQIARTMKLLATSRQIPLYGHEDASKQQNISKIFFSPTLEPL